MNHPEQAVNVVKETTVSAGSSDESRAIDKVPVDERSLTDASVGSDAEAGENTALGSEGSGRDDRSPYQTRGDFRSLAASTLRDWQQAFLASRAAHVLAGLLLVQFLFAGGLFWQASREPSFVASGPLLSFSQQEIDRIEVGSDTSTVVLENSGDSWQIAGDNSLPADETAVNGLLTTLAGLNSRLPVATTEGARAQLDVAEDDFQRRIQLQQEDQVVVDLYVGTSPGFQRAHVRQADSNAIVSAAVNVYDLPDDTDGWLDRTLLAFNDIVRLESDGVVLTREEAQWRAESLTNSDGTATVVTAAVETAAVEGLLSALQDLRVTGLAEPLSAPTTISDEASAATGEGSIESEDNDVVAAEINAAEGQVDSAVQSIRWTVTEEGGEPLLLTLSKQGDEVRVTRSDRPQTFSTSLTSFDKFAEWDADALLSPATPEQSITDAGENLSVDSSATNDNAAEAEAEAEAEVGAASGSAQ